MPPSIAAGCSGCRSAISLNRRSIDPLRSAAANREPAPIDSADAEDEEQTSSAASEIAATISSSGVTTRSLCVA